MEYDGASWSTACKGSMGKDSSASLEQCGIGLHENGLACGSAKSPLEITGRTI